jgi:hypothetical protein
MGSALARLIALIAWHAVQAATRMTGRGLARSDGRAGQAGQVGQPKRDGSLWAGERAWRGRAT